MRIKLILPSFYNEYGTLVKAKKVFVPCVTIRYLAAMVPAGHQVSVIEESVEEINLDEPVDLVGISVQTFSVERAYDIAAEYRKRGVTVVLGGIHVTAVPDEAALHADAVVVGEAEDTWPELIEDFENKKLKSRYRIPGAGLPGQPAAPALRSGRPYQVCPAVFQLHAPDPHPDRARVLP